MDTVSNSLPTRTSGFSHHLGASFFPSSTGFPQLRDEELFISGQCSARAAPWMSRFAKQEHPLWKFPLSILVTPSNPLSLLMFDNSGAATLSGFPVMPAEAASSLPLIHILPFFSQNHSPFSTQRAAAPVQREFTHGKLLLFCPPSVKK